MFQLFLARRAFLYEHTVQTTTQHKSVQQLTAELGSMQTDYVLEAVIVKWKKAHLVLLL